VHWLIFLNLIYFNVILDLGLLFFNLLSFFLFCLVVFTFCLSCLSIFIFFRQCLRICKISCHLIILVSKRSVLLIWKYRYSWAFCNRIRFRCFFCIILIWFLDQLKGRFFIFLMETLVIILIYLLALILI